MTFDLQDTLLRNVMKKTGIDDQRVLAHVLIALTGEEKALFMGDVKILQWALRHADAVRHTHDEMWQILRMERVMTGMGL